MTKEKATERGWERIEIREDRIGEKDRENQRVVGEGERERRAGNERRGKESDGREGEREERGLLTVVGFRGRGGGCGGEEGERGRGRRGWAAH